MEINICQNCSYFNQPICTVKNEFKYRKNEQCEEFKLDENKKINIPKKVIEKVKKKSEEDIKKDILGELKNGPKRPKIKRSKKQNRK